MTIRAGRIVDTSLTARKIAVYERTICAAPAYLARCGVPRRPADLAKHVCIVMAFQTPNRWTFRARDGVDDVEIAPRVTTDNAEAALRLALEGAGIVRLGDIVVAEPVRRGLGAVADRCSSPRAPAAVGSLTWPDAIGFRRCASFSTSWSNGSGLRLGASKLTTLRRLA
jgi:DNA-binding transcriptional LysR family regulator